MRRLTGVLGALTLLAALLAGVAATPAAYADRDFGDDPLDNVLYWAEIRAAETGCGLSGDKLAAIMLAPIWPETGAPTTEAPSPMTMSRWDTQTALHSFADPGSYVEAFWHPGIGMWQFDSAGGWGLTAADRMSSWLAASVASDVMANRYCDNPSFSYVWAPWFGCNSGICEDIYEEIYQNGQLVGIDRDTGVGNLGGVLVRSCSLAGGPAFTCWLVDTDNAQGHDSWAVPSWGASPVSDPYYVFARAGKEERHWLAEHTGFGTAISATRPLGSNARTSLAWTAASTLCDLTTGNGDCGFPTPPPGFTSVATSVNGTYTPMADDFDGDGRGDIFWYAPGGAKDYVWYGSTSQGAFSSKEVSVSGFYVPVAGDFDGDGNGDVFWYHAGPARDFIWWGTSTEGVFSSAEVTVNGAYRPLSGDFDGDGRDDVFWYAPGGTRDYIWYGSASGSFSSVKATVNGSSYSPLSGDFDGDGRDDVFWYAAGTARDYLWLGQANRSFISGWYVNVNGTYTAVAADVGGDGDSDIFWHGHGSLGDYVWYAGGGGFTSDSNVDLGGTYTPAAEDFDNADGDDIIWYQPGSANDVIWYGD